MNAQGSLPGVTQVLQTKAGASREVIFEEPIAIVFNGTTAAVMMATPQDVRDLAYGFALTEGYVGGISDIEEFEEIRHANGVEARLWINTARAEAIAKRRRAMAGPVGCGICGLESLDQVLKPIDKVPDGVSLSPEQITEAMDEIFEWQPLKKRTRSTHAAAFYVPGRRIICAREDVGRHNALDKLVGALAMERIDGATGAVVMTSRVSLELVQKCAVLGCGHLTAASGPTHLAIKTAKASGIRLTCFCRGGGYEAFC